MLDILDNLKTLPNKALLSDKFSAALQICRRARRYLLRNFNPKLKS